MIEPGKLVHVVNSGPPQDIVMRKQNFLREHGENPDDWIEVRRKQETVRGHVFDIVTYKREHDVPMQPAVAPGGGT